MASIPRFNLTPRLPREKVDGPPIVIIIITVTAEVTLWQTKTGRLVLQMLMLNLHSDL